MRLRLMEECSGRASVFGSDRQVTSAAKVDQFVWGLKTCNYNSIRLSLGYYSLLYAFYTPVVSIVYSARSIEIN